MIIDKYTTFYVEDDKHTQIRYSLDNDISINLLISTNFYNAMISISVQWRDMVNQKTIEISRFFTTEQEIRNIITDMIYQLQKNITGGLYET